MQQAGQAEQTVSRLAPLADNGYLDAELLAAEALEETGRANEAARWYRRAAQTGYLSARSALTRLSLPQPTPEKAP